MHHYHYEKAWGIIDGVRLYGRLWRYYLPHRVRRERGGRAGLGGCAEIGTVREVRKA
jgi:hypothetical protein